MIPINQDQCDPNDPQQHALWALRRLPAPARPMISQDLWDAGFRHHPELQTVQYHTDPSLKPLGAHAPAEPMKITKDDIRKRLAQVDPEMAAKVAAAESDPVERARLMEAGRASVEKILAQAEAAPEEESPLAKLQREKIAEVRAALGHTLGDR